jgi:hypothetical protein
MMKQNGNKKAKRELATYAEDVVRNYLLTNVEAKSRVCSEANLCWSYTGGYEKAHEQLAAASEMLSERIREVLEEMLPNDGSTILQALQAYAVYELDLHRIARFFIVNFYEAATGDDLSDLAEESQMLSDYYCENCEPYDSWLGVCEADPDSEF